MERKSNDGINNLLYRWKELGKIKYALLLAAAGVLILLIPTQQQETAAPVAQAIPEESAERRMEEILSQVAGAGDVRVMLTKENEGYVEYQTDLEESRDGERVESSVRTVFGEDDALICRKSAPEYLGAVIVCRGGDSARVRLELVKAACSLTGLTSDKVTVLKMKE